ncbi:hypothetical protein pb186bvf_000756 [Paramecium bursaria]
MDKQFVYDDILWCLKIINCILKFKSSLILLLLQIMNNEEVEIEDYYSSQLIEFKSKIKEESMYQVQKYQLLNETQAFNNTKQQEEMDKKTLVKLIYLINQGTLLNNQEKEQLFFRITKLFQFNDPRLRVLAYKSIKMLIPIQIKILIQSLVKDLRSDDQIIKIEALRTISLIKEEQDFLQIERFINNALLNDNIQIASTALIIGIHISNRFPNIVKKWDQEIQKKFYQKEEYSLYHSLILLHHTKNGQINYLKILVSLTQFQLYPTMTIQIIRLSKQALPQLDDNARLAFINFLKLQLNNPSYEIFLESAKVLIDVMEIQQKEQDIMMNVIIQKLQQPLVNNIETYSALNLLNKLTNINKELYILKKQQIIILERMVINCHTSNSFEALQICINLNQMNTVEYLKSIYIQTITIDGKINFLMGLKELVITQSNFEEQTIELLKIIFLQDCDSKIVDIAIKLVEEMLKKTIQIQLIQLLFCITEQKDIQQKFQVIELLNRLFINLKITKLKKRVVLIWYKYLKEFAEQDQFNTENLLICAYILLNYSKLKQEQIRYNLNEIQRHKITQYDQINQISQFLQENKINRNN